jgi:hypothetical protein
MRVDTSAWPNAAIDVIGASARERLRTSRVLAPLHAPRMLLPVPDDSDFLRGPQIELLKGRQAA